MIIWRRFEMKNNPKLEREEQIANIPKLKIRVQGTKEDIEWFNHFLEKSYAL